MPAVFRCRAALVCSAAVIAVLSSISATAHAQDSTAPAPAAPPPAAGEMPAGQPLYEGTHFGIGTSFNTTSPVLLLAPQTGPLLLGVGLAVDYDRNKATDQTTSDLVLVGAYMIHNVFPFAMGPELDYSTQIMPNGFKNFALSPGWAFWYAPWKAPIVIGGAVFLNIAVADGRGTVVSTASPAVRIVFGFH